MRCVARIPLTYVKNAKKNEGIIAVFLGLTFLKRYYFPCQILTELNVFDNRIYKMHARQRCDNIIVSDA